MIVSGWKIVWQVANMIYKKYQKALSFYKAFKTIIRENIEELKGFFVLRNVLKISSSLNIGSFSFLNHDYTEEDEKDEFKVSLFHLIHLFQ